MSEEQKEQPENKPNELNELLERLQFFSNQPQFNSIIHQGMSIIIDKLGDLNLINDKLSKIEAKLNSKELPELEDGKS
jgi:hypothetical protein